MQGLDDMANALSPKTLKRSNALAQNRNVLAPNRRNELNRTMSFAQQGPESLPIFDQSIDALKQYGNDVVTGKIAKDGINRLNDIGIRMAMREPGAALEMVGEVGGVGSIGRFINPPHEAWDKEKLEKMIQTLKDGGDLPPILLHGDQAYSGSHRLEAWDRMEMEADFVEIDDSDYKRIMESMNLDPVSDSVYDFEPFLEESVWLGLSPGAK